ncbi:MAG: DoxX family membrane protein [Bacteroidales bacterium]|nr:MAG: DoxX family membrane protein [Bacteroidales bacterium]
MKHMVNVCRYLLALLFIFSGFVKGVDPLGFAYKLDDYFKAFHADFLESLSLVLSFTLCAAELFIGLLLLFGVRLRLAAWGAFLFMAFFTPLTFVLAIFNPVHDCGCFGDAIKLTNWETFYKNIVFFAAAIVLLKWRTLLSQSKLALQEVVLFVLLFAIAFLPPYIGYTRLPLYDFRPYRVGVNIPEAMSTPEGAPADVYKTTLYYTKDGEVKEFNETNIPWQDTTWKYVDAKSELVKKGYTPPIESFSLQTTEGNEVTDEVLSFPSYYFLVVSYRLDKSNRKSVDRLNELYFKAKSLGYGFACVTNSAKGDIDAFIARTGAAYPFLNADGIMLKTVIRANPGLVLINRGTIIGKWHYNRIPSADYFSGDLNAKQLASTYSQSKWNLSVLWVTLLGLSFLFVLCLRCRTIIKRIN